MQNRKKNNKTEPLYDIKFKDNTAAFEKDILKENVPKLSYLIRLFNYVFSSARIMCGIFLTFAIILSILQPIIAFIWGRYIENANIYSNASNSHTVHLVSLIGLALLYWLIRFFSELINRYLYGGEDIERLSKVQDHRLQEKFQAKLFKKISKLYPDYMEVSKIQDIIDRCFNSMGGEWSSLQRGVIIEGYVIIANLVSVAMIAVSLYVFHPLLCLLVLVACLPTLYTTYIGDKLNFKFSRDNGIILRRARYYEGVLLGNSAKEVKALNLFEFFFAKWKAIVDDYVDKEKKNQRNVFMLNAASGFIVNLTHITANIFAIILMTQGKLSIGALGAVLMLIGTLIGNTSQLFNSIANFLSKKNDAAQFFELIDLEEEISRNTNKAKAVLDPCYIEACNVTYRYPLTNEYRINNVNFIVHKGEKIAFVGENGSGKTTFIKLLTGMLQPSNGEILLNGRNVKDIDSSEKYCSLSCVFQEPVRFNTFTIAENVTLGDIRKKQNENSIDLALEFSGFTGLKKNAMLGKDIGGTELSGGQWQKLAIARAHYRNGDLIVLDEPTSNLDPLAETEIFKRYIAMAEGKTLIMVTHRISVASLADRVVVFKDGKIVEDGSHDDLLSNGGEYARLYFTQAKWYDR